MGWLFGLKLHLICNEHGELLNFMITSGDVDDRKPLEYKYFVEFVYEKLVGDKGYFLSFYSKIISFPEKIDQIISVPLKSGQININQTIPEKGKN